MLMFQPPDNSKLYRDQFPVVWSKLHSHFYLVKCLMGGFQRPEIIKFVPNPMGNAKATVRYVSRLAFGYAQTVSPSLLAVVGLCSPNVQDDDNLVDASAWTEVKVCPSQAT
jgi:hypothetical protein